MSIRDLALFLNTSGYENDSHGSDGSKSIPSVELAWFDLEILRDMAMG